MIVEFTTVPDFIWCEGSTPATNDSSSMNDISSTHLQLVGNVVLVSSDFTGYAVCSASTLTPCVTFELFLSVSETGVMIV